MKKVIILIVILLCFPLVTKAATNGSIYSYYPDTAVIHSEPSMGSRNIAELYYGTRIEIAETGLGTNGAFSKILYEGNNVGYIASSVTIRDIEYSPVPEDYCNSLTSIGFDASYCPYLYYLHNLHPNWVFTPRVIDKDFNTIIDGEEAKNYLQIISSLGADYFVNKYITSSKAIEGSNWYTATNGMNAFFLDPRNFLSENAIFMFEELGCDENSYWRHNQDKAISSMSSIFGANSYLNTTEDTTTPGESYNYKQEFLEAGLTYKVSPIHLAARVVQEGGSKATYTPITGVYTEPYLGHNINGYFNYYNIGASNGNNPMLNGLVFACGSNCGKTNTYSRPWNTRRKAIFGGAEFIASGYINNGQSTLYLQKFDLNNYSNQYMSNVSAPLSEANKVYSSYKKIGLVNGEVEGVTKGTEPVLNFSIPVFKNMGEVRSVPSILDNSNYLSSIIINGETLKNFDEDIMEYTKYVIDTTTSVNISYSKNNSATVTGDGDITLTDVTTSVTIMVTAENGSSRTYKINIIKVSDTKTINEIMNNVGVKVNNNIIGEIKTNTAVSTIINSINSVSPSANVKVVNSNNEEIRDTSLKTGDKVIVTNLLGETVTYEIAIIGDISGDGEITILDLLKVQKHLVGTNNLTGCNLMAADTNNDNEVTILDLLRIQKHILGTINLG